MKMLQATKYDEEGYYSSRPNAGMSGGMHAQKLHMCALCFRGSEARGRGSLKRAISNVNISINPIQCAEVPCGHVHGKVFLPYGFRSRFSRGRT